MNGKRKKGCKKKEKLLRNRCVHRPHQLIIPKLSVGIEMESDARGDRLELFRVDVPDDRHDRAGLVGWLRWVGARGQELAHGAIRCPGRQIRVQHFLNGFELWILDLKRFRATGEKKNTGNREKETRPQGKTNFAEEVSGRWH